MITRRTNCHGREYNEEDFKYAILSWESIDSHIYPDGQLVLQIGFPLFISFRAETPEAQQIEALNWILTNIRNKDIEMNWFGLRIKLSNIQVYRDTIRTYDRS